MLNLIKITRKIERGTISENSVPAIQLMNILKIKRLVSPIPVKINVILTVGSIFNIYYFNNNNVILSLRPYGKESDNIIGNFNYRIINLFINSKWE